MSLTSGIVNLGVGIVRGCKNNASTILTVTAIIGVAATAVISVECMKRAEEKIRKEEEEKGEPLKPVEKIKSTWYYYIPPVISGVTTMLCIGGAHGIDHRKQLELVAAYNILRDGSDKFKKYAIDEIGKNKVRAIEHKIHEDELKERPPKKETLDRVIFDATAGGVVLMDTITGQEFPTTYERIYSAAERCNKKLRNYSGGGEDWWPWSNFIEDCGGEYAAGAECWGFPALPFSDNIDINTLCDPQIQDYNGHKCTVVRLNIMPERRERYDPQYY